MMDFVKKQKESVSLICDAVDILQRNFKEIPILDELRTSGKIEIHFLREKQVLDKKANSTQLMAYQLFNLISINCARASSDNAKRGIQQKLQNGECIGKAPIGYLNVRDAKGKADIIIDTEKAPLIKKIFEMYSLGSTSLGDLEKFVRQNNLTNNFLCQHEIKPITRNVICRILQNPFYAGLMLVKGVLYKHKYPVIITKELFDKCQEVRGLKSKS